MYITLLVWDTCEVVNKIKGFSVMAFILGNVLTGDCDASKAMLVAQKEFREKETG